MREIREIAYTVVARAVAFAALGIFCFMVGLSFNLKLAFQTGAFFTTLTAAILVLKAAEAPRKPYRRTELWLYIPDNLKPPEATAQWAAATVMREAYLTFAYWAALLAIGLWASALLIGLIRL
jgi:hypothetical protein